jgi:hypothetical protein
MSFIAGIDAGLKGALCLMTEKGGIVSHQPIPITKDNDFNYEALSEIISWWKGRVSMCYMEKLWGQPKQSSKSTFGLGKSYGVMLGMLGAWQIPTELVAPKTWQAEIYNALFSGKYNRLMGSKDKALEASKILYPDLDMVIGRARKPHDGLVDSLLIAEYGRRQSIRTSLRVIQ